MIPSTFNLRSQAQGLALLIIVGTTLAACGTVGDVMSPAFVDPARYDLWDCKQLAPERKSLANRLDDLQRLMTKAETGTGGVVISEIAYRNDYISVRAQQKLLEQTWERNKCRESDAVVTPPPAPTPAPAVGPKPAQTPKPAGAIR